jgi:hypothetical protein
MLSICSIILTGKKLRWALRDWLSPPDPFVNYNTALEALHKGTVTWFTQGHTFTDWKQSSSLLWMYGKHMPSCALPPYDCQHTSLFIAGTGKSVLAYVPPNCFDCSDLHYQMLPSTAVIQNINGIFNDGSAYIGYFFFDFKDTGKWDICALLLSLLIQPSNQSDSYSDKLLTLYSSHHCRSKLPKLGNSTLMRCLEEILTLPQQIPVYLIIDALDECPYSSGIPSSCGKLLKFVKVLVESHLPNLWLFATSCPENDIWAVLRSLTYTSISLHDQDGQMRDIVDYINHVVHSEMDIMRWREEDKNLVIKTLSAKAGGM